MKQKFVYIIMFIVDKTEDLFCLIKAERRRNELIKLITKMDEMPTCCEDCQLSHYWGSNLQCGQDNVNYKDSYISMIEREPWTRHKNCPLIDEN